MNIIIRYNNTIKNIEIESNDNYKTIIEKIENCLYIKYDITRYYIIVKNKHFTENNSENVLNYLINNDIINIGLKINGGLESVINLLLNADKFFAGLLDIVLQLISIFGLVFEMIPLIFKPDALIDAVMGGVINGINFVIKNLLSNLSIDRNSNSKNEERLGVFGVSDKTRAICLPPSIMDLIILVLCPPLVLFLKKKWSFFFQIILCALLTYKLYYFPGFIFAAVYVLF